MWWVITKKIATEKTREKLLPKTSDRKDVTEVLLSQGFFDKGTKLMFWDQIAYIFIS